MSGGKAAGPRNVALVGPYLSGKTTMMEAMLFAAGAIGRLGAVTEGNSVGDGSAEARARQMGVELNAAHGTFLDSPFTFLDCPGSIEFLQETLNALVGADVAVLVCEAEADKAVTVWPVLKFLEEQGIPRVVFINKIDRATHGVELVMEALQNISKAPLVLRQIPIPSGDTVSGYIDLASRRAYQYQPGDASLRVDMPAEMSDMVEVARMEMLEKLADFDDTLMEKLLEDETPEDEEVFANLTKVLRDGEMVPVLIGAGGLRQGVWRLLKLLRHETPDSAAAAARKGLDAAGPPLAQVLKTYHTQHGGKQSLARVWRGAVKDGAILGGERLAGVFRMMGHATEKVAEAKAGDVVALGRLEQARTGDTLSPEQGVEPLPRAQALPAVYHLAIRAADRADEVKLTTAINKVTEEDPSLAFVQNQDTHQMLLYGQGDMHLKVAFDRLRNKYGLNIEAAGPKVPYKEAIRKAITQRGRHKKQTGGHGQFGDVVLDIKPLPRGSGFNFESAIVGGVVPRQYIPAVEAGVKEYLGHGPLGFPVVDVAVILTDGSYHSVDSSELAFKTAARIAMSEGMPQCNPVLLEPVLHVKIHAPSEFTARINSVITGRRGQILGFDARPGWPGWDTVEAHMPQAEIHDLIIELRSLSLGVATYTAEYDRLQELTGPLADKVLAQASA